MDVYTSLEIYRERERKESRRSTREEREKEMKGRRREEEQEARLKKREKMRLNCCCRGVFYLEKLNGTD